MKGDVPQIGGAVHEQGVLAAFDRNGLACGGCVRGEGVAVVVGGQKIGIKHQGHIAKKDVRLGNLWQTMFGVMGVKVPDKFQGGEADGVIKELV